MRLLSVVWSPCSRENLFLEFCAVGSVEDDEQDDAGHESTQNGTRKWLSVRMVFVLLARFIGLSSYVRSMSCVMMSRSAGRAMWDKFRRKRRPFGS